MYRLLARKARDNRLNALSTVASRSSTRGGSQADLMFRSRRDPHVS